MTLPNKEGILLVQKSFFDFNRYDHYSKSKLRSTVNHVMFDTEPNHSLIRGFKIISSSRYSATTRVVWLVILVLCFALCVYQTYDRLQYFLTKPVAVDILSNHPKLIKFPVITMCSQDTEAMAKADPPLSSLFSSVNFKKFNSLVSLIGEQKRNLSDLWSLTNVGSNLSAKLFEENKPPRTVNSTDRLHPIGICHQYQIKQQITNSPFTKLEMRFQHYSASTLISNLMGDIKSESQMWDMRNSIFIAIGATADIEIAMKTYKFLNTSSTLCVNNKLYSTCLHNCLLEKHEELGLPNCKFPFFDVDLPICSINQINDTDYIKSAQLYFRLDPVYQCGCLKNCERIVFDWNEQVFNLDPGANKTIINVRFKNDGNVTVSQRYNYDYVTFLGDIGGNLGLFLNLSILSICEVFYSFWGNSYSQPVSSFDKSLRYKVELTLTKNKKKSTPKCDNWKFLRCVIFILCLAVAILNVVVAFKNYLSYPIVTTIAVTENRTIYFPILTVCGDGKEFVRIKRKAKGCNLTFDQVLKIKDDIVIKKILRLVKNSNFAEYFWNSTSLGNVTLTKDTETELYNNTFWRLPGKGHFSEVMTPFGYCHEYKIEPQIYSGTHSVFIFIYATDFCNRKSQQTLRLYLNEQTQLFSPISQRKLPLPGKISVTFAAQKIQRLDRKGSPCLNTEKANKCQINCIRNLLKVDIPCSLPFLNYNSTMCSNITLAAQALDMYLEFITSRCKCQKRCTETIYDVRIHSEPREAPVSVVIFFYRHNFVENINENYSYAFVTFLCNIGGFLGLTLGVSILSIVDLMQMSTSLIGRLCRKI